MVETLLKYPEVVVPVAILIAVAITANTFIRYRLRVKQWEMSLKHAMLERGMSAEEIKAVLDACGKDLPEKVCHGNWSGSQKDV